MEVSMSIRVFFNLAVAENIVNNLMVGQLIDIADDLYAILVRIH